MDETVEGGVAGAAMTGGLPGPDGALARAQELLAAGGAVVAILLAMSVAAVAITLVKLMQFRTARIDDRRPARRALTLWRQGRRGEAFACAEGSRNPAAQAMLRAMLGCHRGLPEAMVREEVLRFGTAALESLRGWLRPLEVTASLAPLLGLFGTVLGMISAFQQLEAAGNQVNPAILSGGIWEALLTTAAGLAVAIPTVALVHWLERRVDRLAHEMDDLVTMVFTEDLVAVAGRREVGIGNEDRRDAPAGYRTAQAG
mgnify:CR=1|jgi:biopolymer transport protein ExbB